LGILVTEFVRARSLLNKAKNNFQGKKEEDNELPRSLLWGSSLAAILVSAPAPYFSEAQPRSENTTNTASNTESVFFILYLAKNLLVFIIMGFIMHHTYEEDMNHTKAYGTLKITKVMICLE
jgi:hypothetical protein